MPRILGNGTSKKPLFSRTRRRTRLGRLLTGGGIGANEVGVDLARAATFWGFFFRRFKALLCFFAARLLDDALPTGDLSVVQPGIRVTQWKRLSKPMPHPTHRPTPNTLPRRAWLAVGLMLLVWSGWSTLALALGGVGADGPSAIRPVIGILAAIGSTALSYLRGRQAGALAIGLACLGVTLWFASIRPSNDREWNEDQGRLPRVSFNGSTVNISDIRSFRYRSADDWDARWFDATYDLDTVQGVDFAVERFTENEAVAHTLLSFRFDDGRALAVSVEIRKEVGETYGVVAGMFRQYELMVVLGDERDLLELRAVHRGDTVYLHPMRASREDASALLESLLRTAQTLQDKPRWYHTVSASCTSVLAQHLQTVADVPLDHRVYLPGYSDALAFELGLIATDVDFETTRAQNRIDERARAAAGQTDFGQRIRAGRTGASAPLR